MVTITLSSELERVVSDEAARKGTTAERVTLDALQQRFLGVGSETEKPTAGFIALFEELDRFLALRPGWNGYDAPPPNRQAVSTGASALIALQRLPSPPNRLAPSAVGGVGITYRMGNRKAYVECYNNGQVVLLLSDPAAEQMQTHKIEPTSDGFSRLPGLIKDYLDGGSA